MKDLTLIQAKAKVKKLANGRYHIVRQEITEYTSHKVEIECTVYIDILSPTWTSFPTFREAIANVETCIKELQNETLRP